MEILAAILFQHLRKLGILRIEKVERDLHRLYQENREQTQERVRQYYIRILKQMLWVLLVMISLCGIWILWSKAGDSENLSLIREDYGGEESTCTLEYWREETEKKELTVTVEPVRYREEELNRRFQEGFSYLEGEMLGENKSLEQIQDSMNLLTNIPDSGLSVKWYSDDYTLIDEQGIVNNVGLPEARTVWLQLELSYEDTVQTREYEVVIQPKHLTEEEMEKEQLQQAIEKLLRESEYEKQVSLPAEIQGIHLAEKKNEKVRVLAIILLCVGVLGMLWFRQKEELQQRLNRQKADFQRSYPYLVNQLVLYVNAGATLQDAFERILQPYEDGKRKPDSLYKVLKIMKNEMHSGVSREQAYIRLGKRIGLPEYLKLTSLFVQQSQKGSGGLTLQLEQAEREAFEHRKEWAKRLGEKAGTKLLFPMILLMLISMVIVLCPTLLQFYN